MVDPACLGHEFTPVVATVEAERLDAYFAAIGETNPSMIEPDSSGAVAVPPAYLFCLEMLHAQDPFAFVNEIGVSIEDILHADQHFAYHHTIHVGDTLTYRSRVVDLIEKRNGALTFLVQAAEIFDQDARLVAETKRTFAVRNQAASS